MLFIYKTWYNVVMMNINYIKAYTNKIVINNIKTIEMSIVDYLDLLLLKQLTTYQGRIDSIKKIYGIKKLVPIYIDPNINLFPVYNLKDYENIYINVVNILKVKKHKNSSLICFKGGDELLIDKNITILNKYIKRALRINHNS